MHWTKASTARDAVTTHAKSSSNIGMPIEKIGVAMVHMCAFENIADETKNEKCIVDSSLSARALWGCFCGVF